MVYMCDLWLCAQSQGDAHTSEHLLVVPLRVTVIIWNCVSLGEMT